jgi:hypothetical protein
VKSWANEQKNTSLKINLYSPGPVRTAMRAQAYARGKPIYFTRLPKMLPHKLYLYARLIIRKLAKLYLSGELA